MKRGNVRPSFRIPLHAHTNPRTGGVVGVGTGGGGGSGGGGGGGGSTPLTVSDGVTSVTSVTEIDFTSGATVTDLGGFKAGVSVSGGGSMVPYYIPPATTFEVPLYSQALFKQTIEVDGLLIVNGLLLGVN